MGCLPCSHGSPLPCSWCSRAKCAGKSGGCAATTPQEPQERERSRKTAKGSPQGRRHREVASQSGAATAKARHSVAVLGMDKRAEGLKKGGYKKAKRKQESVLTVGRPIVNFTWDAYCKKTAFFRHTGFPAIPQEEQAMRRLRIGHIGWLANDQSEFAETVAWCDANPERLKKSLVKCPAITGYNDYRGMLEHPGLDLVVIATPNWFHCEMACEFLDRGIHVFLEKPMGINRDEIDQVLEAANRSKAQIAVDFEMRISPFAQKVKGLIGPEGLGDLRRMELVHHRGGWLEEGNGVWRTRTEKSGGLFLMEPIHAIDLFRMVAGEVEAVQTISGPNVLANYGFPDNACSHLFFEGGVTATLLTSHTLSAQTGDPSEWTTRGHEMRWVFTCSRGTFSVDLLRKNILVNRYEPYPEGAVGTRVVFDHVWDFPGDGDAFHHDITAMRQDFIRRCSEGRAPLQDIHDAWRTHVVCLAAEQSAGEGGRRIQLEYSKVNV
jgi:predicted dehydrogenase